MEQSRRRKTSTASTSSTTTISPTICTCFVWGGQLHSHSNARGSVIHTSKVARGKGGPPASLPRERKTLGSRLTLTHFTTSAVGMMIAHFESLP